ncbi:MAG: PEP-CTERM/exosortase system-associated acyltransferase [Gammaproteobacteria bacterium]
MFDDQFEVILADTWESKEIHYSIRYQVYCEESGFENSRDFPFKREHDRYDDRAIHFIVRHKTTGQWIGAMRLIRKTDQLLPIELHCRLDQKINKSGSGQGAVELSRLCLIIQIRRKYSDTKVTVKVMEGCEQIRTTDKIRTLNDRRVNRSILWGLIYAAAKYSYQNNIPNWYFMTTQALEKILRNGGLDMTTIGAPCDYRGKRFPFAMNAFETFLGRDWQDHFRTGYRVYSELSRVESSKAA